MEKNNKHIGTNMSSNIKEETPSKAMTNCIKMGFRAYVVTVITTMLLMSASMTVFATGGTSDPVQIVNNLSSFIFGLIRAVGLILLGFGVVQVGLSLKSHDPSQRANGFLTLTGGIIITFAKEILDLILA